MVGSCGYRIFVSKILWQSSQISKGAKCSILHGAFKFGFSFRFVIWILASYRKTHLSYTLQLFFLLLSVSIQGWVYFICSCAEKRISQSILSQIIYLVVISYNEMPFIKVSYLFNPFILLLLTLLKYFRHK